MLRAAPGSCLKMESTLSNAWSEQYGRAGKLNHRNSLRRFSGTTHETATRCRKKQRWHWSESRASPPGARAILSSNSQSTTMFCVESSELIFLAFSAAFCAVRAAFGRTATGPAG